MKKYKLLKWYPSLPKDWEVGMEVGQRDRESWFSYSSCNIGYTEKRLDAELLKNNPEYWEKVIEKDYEIFEV